MVAESLTNASSLLRKYWGYDSLRPLQGRVIDAALARRDALIVMPTGGGKSLCFQLPPLIEGGLTLVISPLIALMKDQVDGLKILDYPAAALNSSLSLAETLEVESRVRSGEIKLLYTSPERLVTAEMRQLLREANGGRGVARVAIDEAHCISGWGHDFRPEYRQLSSLKKHFPGVPIHAFTATATPKVREDILQQLGLDLPEVIIGTFDRPNLTYRIVAKSDPVRQIAEAAKNYPEDAVIVYCLSRKDTERIASGLSVHGVRAVAYHAGLEPVQRAKISEDFARERVNVIVATIAFGMGIDRGNVRCVIHETMPKSVEGYQQETGRAGRDGLPSECILLYNNSDMVRITRVITMGGRTDYTEHQIRLLEEVRRFATGPVCRHKYLSEYFGQEFSASKCDACDVCEGGIKEVENSTRVAQKIIATVNDLRRQNPSGFGAGHITQVLIGAGRKAIREKGHDKLRGYGCFRSEGSGRVNAWMNQLLDEGYLALTQSDFPTVYVTEKGQGALTQGAFIELYETAAVAKTEKSKAAGGEMFEHLRAWRRGVSADREVPAYVIMHDSVLMEIAAKMPSTIAGLQSVKGLGEARIRDFGKEILQIVAANRPVPIAKTTSRSSEIFALFDRGLPIDQVCEESGLKASTVYGYLADWIALSKPSSVSAYVTEADYSLAKSAFEEVGFTHLKPAYEHLEGRLPYEILRIVRAHIGLFSPS